MPAIGTGAPEKSRNLSVELDARNLSLMDNALNPIVLPAGEAFLDDLAHAMLAQCAGAVDAGDLSSALVLVPALPIAAELRSAMLGAVSRPLLLPRFDTLTHWAGAAPLAGLPEPLPASERLVLLHEALRERGWFDESALWGVAAEMAGLFDELTAAAVSLPADEAALAAQLQRAYAMRASAPLAFEARVVHELWRALAALGASDAASLYRLRLAALLKDAAGGGQRPSRLLMLLDAAPEEALDPAECDFLQRYGQLVPVSVFHPAPRRAAVTPLMTLLSAAWPELPASDVPPLFARARTLVAAQPASPLPNEAACRLTLVPVEGREPEAQAAVAQIGQWLQNGLRRIALIAQDRLTARRVRALLERENVLVNDETGWKLSTSRTAAAVDALIETAAGGAYYRDLLDLCKSPCIFADGDSGDEGARKAAVFALEAAIRGASIKSGVPRFRRCLQEADDSEARTLGLALLDRIEAATTLLRAKPAPLARWLNRLRKALEVLGAIEALQQDIAGKAMLDLLEARASELAENTALFSLAAWRDWLNREFEAATFRDAGISSPIVVTPLNAVCMRRFEAALLIGGDARQLTPAVHGEFFNQSVRRELGLRTREDGERELRRDLELLLATVPRVVVTWQAQQDGEANLLAPELSLLSTVHQLAWGDDLRRRPLPARREAQPAEDTAPAATAQAAPVAPLPLVPRRVSVSGYESLVACPYRFFARHVLRLGELEEVSETMEKSDYGALVHRVLERFHERHPSLAGLPEAAALSALQECVAEVFAPAVEENFLATGWKLRWEKRLLAYLQWQREREAEGWRWSQAETRVRRELPLADGASVELYGRIDRIDAMKDQAAVSLLDYKTQKIQQIRERLKDDVQLPAYALLVGDAAQAAYVALDDDKVTTLAAGGEAADLMVAAQAQGQRLQTAFSALRAGARLPAHGADSVCQWCEMNGLCRRQYV